MPQLRRRGSLRRRKRPRQSKSYAVTTCKFCLKLYELFHSKLLSVFVFLFLFQSHFSCCTGTIKAFFTVHQLVSFFPFRKLFGCCY